MLLTVPPLQYLAAALALAAAGLVFEAGRDSRLVLGSEHLVLLDRWPARAVPLAAVAWIYPEDRYDGVRRMLVVHLDSRERLDLEVPESRDFQVALAERAPHAAVGYRPAWDRLFHHGPREAWAEVVRTTRSRVG